MLKKVELVIDAKASLGEGPCWDHQNQLLYWVNINDKRVCIFNPVTNENREIELNQLVGAIVPRTSGGAIVALENGFYSLNLTTESLKPIIDPEEHLPNNRFNDGKCDSRGRFWAGTMDKSKPKDQGALYCLDLDMKVVKKVDKVGISNGMAWSLDNEFLYYIDTPTRKVVRFNFNIDVGEISNSTDIIHFPEDEGSPDGMTIDEEGMLWIAHWGGAKISRWNPNTGKQIQSIPIPALNVTSCTFGGKDLDELYITTARIGMSDKQLEEYPFAGGVFKIKPGVKGLHTNFFQG